MQMKPIRARRVDAGLFGCALVLSLAACSDQEILAPEAAPIFTSPVTEASTVAAAGTATSSAAIAGEDGTNPTAPSDSAGVTSPVVEPIESNAIPGLNSDDRFCAAWSRFAGSFQIISPAWLIADDPAESIDPGQLEASAAQTMIAAYYEMGTSWPDGLAAAKDQSLAVYQPMFERMNRSVGFLRGAGATDEQLLEIAAWWEVQLAEFDGFTFPDPRQAPVALVPLIEQAGTEVITKEVPMPEDQALVQPSEPLVDLFDYLASNCPDQGLLSGREVLDGA